MNKQYTLFLTALFACVSGRFSAQEIFRVGAVNLVNCKILEDHLVNDSIYGQLLQVHELVVSASTRVQMSCNLGDPSKNRYETVQNKLSVTILADPDGKLKDSVVAEIRSYYTTQEAWYKKHYPDRTDLRVSWFYKSFYLSGSSIIPVIDSGKERNGDYRLYYLDRQLIKVTLLEHTGLGCLSRFTQDNLFFSNEQGKIVFDFYVRDVDEIRKLADEFSAR